MKLRITGPDNVTWEYQLADCADALVTGFLTGELERITFTEKAPEMARGWPLRFELTRA